MFFFDGRYVVVTGGLEIINGSVSGEKICLLT